MCAAFNKGISKVVLAGVPEQVNIPISICLERGIFDKYGVDLEYKIVPEGTGAMLDKLESGEADIAFTVTDGFIAGKAKGRKVELIGVYVESPLIWAVATSLHSTFHTIEEMISLQRNNHKLKIGVSRLGSGSYTMSYYMSNLYGLNMTDIEFIVAHNIKGLTKGVQDNLFDIFLWETNTTQPLFAAKEIKKIGEVSTPWPAFSIVTGVPPPPPPSSSSSPSQSLEERNCERYTFYREKVFPALCEGIQLFLDDSKTDSSVGGGVSLESCTVQRISNEFHCTREEAVTWLSRTRYALPALSVNSNVFISAVKTLQNAGLVPNDFQVNDLWSSNTAITLL
mmetsp:Transcript_14716/g.14814  ORF Transcript_14716/g.14814 Transcript_14716/m.14814 type:complete len:339 (-) Transcript_14716:33-1049(-)